MRTEGGMNSALHQPEAPTGVDGFLLHVLLRKAIGSLTFLPGKITPHSRL